MSFLDKLNLTTQEKRLVVVVAIVVIVVLNFVFIWPHFADWSRIQAQLAADKGTLAMFQKKLAQTNVLEAKRIKLEGDTPSVIPDEQDLQMQETIRNQARESKITINSMNSVPATGSTNEFFTDQIQRMTFSNCSEKDLVDFLLTIGSGDSMIRVRDLDINPQEPGRFKLQGTMTLVASYQKRPPVKLPIQSVKTTSAIPPAPGIGSKPGVAATNRPAVPAPVAKTNSNSKINPPFKTTAITNKVAAPKK